MQYAAIRKALRFLQPTPFHPQWLSFREALQTRAWVGERARGVVLDIGCAGSSVRPYLKRASRYIGLDYYATARDLYGTSPDVYGDGQSLPLRKASVESVLLLDVLEHLPQPGKCLAEIHLVLKEEGKLLLQTPFLYPLHDEPYDFQRLTIYGLKDLLARKGFVLEEVVPLGKPLTTAALLANLALSQTLLGWFAGRNPLVLLGMFAPLFILATNCLGWIFSRTGPESALMPQGYRLLCRKKEVLP